MFSRLSEAQSSRICSGPLEAMSPNGPGGDPLVAKCGMPHGWCWPACRFLTSQFHLVQGRVMPTCRPLETRPSRSSKSAPVRSRTTSGMLSISASVDASDGVCGAGARGDQNNTGLPVERA